tara:strand:+ start:1292 stop:1486 length:195 start_codon:yes stop_codon:yes gene_type:complete
MSTDTQAAKQSIWLCILVVERASNLLNSFAETSQAVTNRSTQASKPRSQTVRGIVIYTCLPKLT